MSDYVEWTRQQAALLREVAATSNAPVDWDRVIEEIEDLGKGEKRELRSRVRTVVQHLLKLRYSPATDPRAGWEETVDRSREEIAEILEESDSLHDDLPEIVTKAVRSEGRLVARDLLRRKEVDATTARAVEGTKFSVAEVLG